MVTGIGPATGYVVIVKSTLELPAETVTVAGTVATDGTPLLSEIVTPPIGAGPVSVTVPWGNMPPTTLVGLSESELKAGGLTVSVATLELPPLSAEIATGVELTTG